MKNILISVLSISGLNATDVDCAHEDLTTFYISICRKAERQKFEHSLDQCWNAAKEHYKDNIQMLKK